ncbi:hypothetical protein SAY87_012524 [Trapa incisa]|uniref:HMA domain-containing protein n=1 Tax=Trapa incisa TaxID=236973 RepID=A0AAN7JJI0_9MYRT|nr:hypothetical protein SAY87_012524 [Trapa incisa]
MNKEETLKIQTYVLKVNIHCDGCKQKVKKVLQKIDGVFTTKIDSEQGKVTVSGIVDPALLIKKLTKSGKHAEIWGSQQNPNLNHQLNNLQIDPKNSSKEQRGHNNIGNDNKYPPPKGGGQQQFPFTPLQNQQMKAFQDLKLPPLKDLKMPGGGFKDPVQNPIQPKAVKFSLPPEDDLMSGDEFDDEFDDDDDDDKDGDEFEDEMDDLHNNYSGGKKGDKIMKPSMGGNGGMSGGANRPSTMLNALMNGSGGGNNGNTGSGGGGGGAKSEIAKGGKKGNDPNRGGGAGKNGGKNGGGGGSGMDGPNGTNGQNGGGDQQNHGEKGIGDRLHSMGKGLKGHGGGGGIPIGHMGAMPAIQGLPAAGQAYFQGRGPDATNPGSNQYPHQQYLAAMMNQQRAAAMANGGVGGGGDPRFQPMMCARPATPGNYMPPNLCQYPPNLCQYPHPYPYPYPPPHSYAFIHPFSDENTTSGCSIM